MTPWRREPRKAGLAALIMAVAVGGSWWFSGQALFALVAALILWGSIGPFFVSSRFVLSEEGVEVDSLFLKRRRRWRDLKSWYVDRYGVTLSPFAGRSWLESYRSVRLLYGDHREQVLAVVRERLGEPAAAPR